MDVDPLTSSGLGPEESESPPLKGGHGPVGGGGGGNGSGGQIDGGASNGNHHHNGGIGVGEAGTLKSSFNDGDDLQDETIIDMDRLLLRKSPFAVESGPLALGEFEAGEDLKEMVQEAKVLVVGAGGLGCEILKNLALSGVKVRVFFLQAGKLMCLHQTRTWLILTTA